MNLSALTMLDRDPVFDFDYMEDAAFAQDVHEGYRKIKESAPPVFWTPLNSGHWVANSREAVNKVLRTPSVFSSRYVTFPRSDFSPRMIPLTLDPPEHLPYRKLLQPFFDDQAVRAMAPKVLKWAHRLIDRVIEDKHCEFVDAMASRLPISVFMQLMGMPLDEFERFRAIAVTYFGSLTDIAARTRLAEEIHEINRDLFAQRRAAPQDDLLSRLLELELDGRKLDDEELKSITFVMFVGGLDTVVNAMSFGMRHLALDRPLQEAIIADPARIPALVEELLRRYSFVQTRRLILQDIELEGAQLRAGDAIFVPLMMVGWDEERVTCPFDVSLDRKNAVHAAFGGSNHTCLGMHLAKLELATLYRVWFERIGHFRLAVPQDAIRVRAGLVMAIEALPLAWD
ncbi:cytochrome P450 [Novosphingobium sp. BL-52-GroH]|uniref:cytochrome P450 n=1 Tax=Novosphingobium sp. BL-52-GroH TaxID=3349877 RepID=UPI00384F6AC1